MLLLGFYDVDLHVGIARYAREAGWAINNQYGRSGYPAGWWRGDGIIALITTPKDVRALECFPALPLVDVSKGWICESMPVADRSSGLGKPRVYYDNVKIARLAAGHFLQRGFKHVAYVNIGNYWHEVERIPTIRQMVGEAGGLFHEIAFHRHRSGPADSPAAGFAAAHAWLAEAIAKLPKPLGIVASSDDDAVSVLQACDDAGIAVPEEVAVLGCDNDALLCDHAPVPLSSVDIDWERIGYEASGLLERLMDGEAAPAAPILIPPKGVVTRQSTDILAIPDARIARALRCIWQNFTQQIGTPEVAAAAGLNRRKLERDFRFHLHRSVSDEIQRVRVECAKKLLLETDRKISDIGWDSGFFDAAHFSNAFVRATGTRPGAFRRGNVAGVSE